MPLFLRHFKQVIFLASLILLVLGQTVYAQETAATQIWLMNSYRQRFDYSLLLSVETENRFYSEGTFHRRFEFRPLLTWNYSPRYDFTIGYQNSVSELNQTVRKTDIGHQLVTAVTLKWEFADYLLTSRQQLQHGEESAESITLFRHRVRINYLSDNLPLRLSPFIQNEWFLECEDGHLRENRLTAGLSYPINANLKLSLFGMRRDQWTLSDQHTASPVTGVMLNLDF